MFPVPFTLFSSGPFRAIILFYLQQLLTQVGTRFSLKLCPPSAFPLLGQGNKLSQTLITYNNEHIILLINLQTGQGLEGTAHFYLAPCQLGRLKGQGLEASEVHLLTGLMPVLRRLTHLDAGKLGLLWHRSLSLSLSVVSLAWQHPHQSSHVS